MAAQLNIKNLYVVELPQSLAQAEGKSVTIVIREALMEMLERQKGNGTGKQAAE